MLAADLHVHLDGSLRASTLAEFARDRGMYPRDASDAELTSGLVFEQGMSLTACLRRFEATVGLLQSAGALTRVAAELIEDCYSDGVRHAEIRLCPLLHTREGLRPEEALEAVLTGIEHGTSSCSTGRPPEWMSGRVVIAVLEDMGESESSSLIDLALRYADRGVVGVDLAGDESLFRPECFETHFARARDAGLGVTIHAGESGGPEHVGDAVRALGADRVGHGTSAPRDPAVLALLAERGITVECCVTSNVHTGAIARYEDHPLPVFLDAGVRVVLATDNRFFSQTSLSREYDIAAELLGVGRSALERVALESASASFLPRNERAELERLITSSIEAEDGRPTVRTPGAARAETQTQKREVGE